MSEILVAEKCCLFLSHSLFLIFVLHMPCPIGYQEHGRSFSIQDITTTHLGASDFTLIKVVLFVPRRILGITLAEARVRGHWIRGLMINFGGSVA